MFSTTFLDLWRSQIASLERKEGDNSRRGGFNKKSRRRRRRKEIHPHNLYLALYSTFFQKTNSRKVTSWVFSCISDAMVVFILEYALLYAIWEVLNKNPLLQA